MKTLNILLATLFLGISLQMMAEDHPKKKIRLKVEKEVNGKKISIDTTFQNFDKDKLEKFLEEYELKSIHIENDELLNGSSENISFAQSCIIVSGDSTTVRTNISPKLEVINFQMGDKLDSNFNCIRINSDIQLHELDTDKVQKIVIQKSKDKNANGKQVFIYTTGKTATSTSKEEIKLDDEIHLEVITDVNIDDIQTDAEHIKIIQKNGKDIRIGSKLIQISDSDAKTKKIEIKYIEDSEEEEPINVHEEEMKLAEFEVEMDDDFKLFPNPNNGNFKIQYQSDQKAHLQIKVMDQQGQIVYQKKKRNFSGNMEVEVNLKKHKPGTYILHLSHGEKQLKRKFMVQ